jgi:hypothetical protein
MRGSRSRRYFLAWSHQSGSRQWSRRTTGTRYYLTAPSGVSLTAVGTFLAEHPPNMNVDRHPLQLALRPLDASDDGVKALSRGLNTEFFNPMSHLLLRSLTALVCLGVFSLPQTSAAPKPDQSDTPNLSGTWALDLKASASLEPLMNQIGASFLERKYATSTEFKATFHQTENVLTVATRGSGFALDETLYLDGRTDPSNLQLMGATSLQTKAAWSDDHKQLVETHQIKTKQGKEGQLIITRYLTDGGNTLVVAFALKLNTEPDRTSARQIWRKQT